MHTYVLTSALLNGMAIFMGLVSLGFHLPRRVETDASVAFRIALGIFFLGWACYLLMQGA
jgi:hypothetical protein